MTHWQTADGHLLCGQIAGPDDKIVDDGLLELQRQWSRPAITHSIMGKKKKSAEPETSRLF
jgi:hypothetical protein